MKQYFLFLVLLNGACFAQLPKKPFKVIGGKQVYSMESKNVLLVTSGFMVDADGSPRAYHSDNAKALDYLANAGKPGNWWALATDNKKSSGKPVVQSASDPAPGYYVSMTSLVDATKKYDDPNRYVNSETVPYIALPPKLSPDFKQGDIALVVNTKNNKRCFAIFADVGPRDKIGEGSVFLATQLGIKSNPKNGGTNAGIMYVLIKNSGNHQVLTHEAIQQLGRSKLSEQDIADILQ